MELNSRVTTKPVTKLTKDEIQQCRDLTLFRVNGTGMLHGVFNQALRNKDSNVYATYLKGDGRLVGWAFTFPQDTSRRGTYFFVDPELRRMGIGTHLYRSVRRKFGNVEVFPWDDRSRAFFGKVKSNGDSISG